MSNSLQPMDYIFHGILQARILEWVKVKVKSLSRVRLFATPWTVAYQAPRSMGFSRQEYWSGLPFPSPGDLPNPGIEPGSPALQTDTLPSEPLGSLSLLQWIFLTQELNQGILHCRRTETGLCRNQFGISDK